MKYLIIVSIALIGCSSTTTFSDLNVTYSDLRNRISLFCQNVAKHNSQSGTKEEFNRRFNECLNAWGYF